MLLLSELHPCNPYVRYSRCGSTGFTARSMSDPPITVLPSGSNLLPRVPGRVFRGHHCGCFCTKIPAHQSAGHRGRLGCSPPSGGAHRFHSPSSCCPPPFERRSLFSRRRTPSPLFRSLRERVHISQAHVAHIDDIDIYSFPNSRPAAR